VSCGCHRARSSLAGRQVASSPARLGAPFALKLRELASFHLCLAHFAGQRLVCACLALARVWSTPFMCRPNRRRRGEARRGPQPALRAASWTCTPLTCTPLGFKCVVGTHAHAVTLQRASTSTSNSWISTSRRSVPIGIHPRSSGMPRVPSSGRAGRGARPARSHFSALRQSCPTATRISRSSSDKDNSTDEITAWSANNPRLSSVQNVARFNLLARNLGI
jgi:hypothetical protein